MTASADEISVSPTAFSLNGHHIVVTGGGRGLGRGIAVSVARAGATVTVVSRSVQQLESTADIITAHGGLCHTHAADVADHDQADRHIASISDIAPIDGIVHAAGVQVRKPAVEVTPADWRYVQSVNADAPFFWTTAVARRQLATGRTGSHVFIGSLNSTIGLPRIAPYAASKTAMLGMARSLSTEWAASNLRVNVVAPGYFHTELTADLLANQERASAVLDRIPAGRLGTAADLGGAVVFLLSPASSYLTGQLINIDGGWLAA